MSRIAVKIAGDTSELVKMERDAKRFSERFQQAFEFTSGVAAFAGITGFLDQIKDGFVDTVKEGVAFNAQLESAQLGVAAIFKQFAGAKFTTFDAALVGADEAVAALKAKAAETNATFSQLLESYQATTGQMFAAGIGDMKKQVDTVGLLANAVSAVVADKSQLVQETRAILTGNITGDAMAAKTFGITSQDIKTAKEAGRLAEYLQEKLSAFAEAGKYGGKTYSVAIDNIKEQWAGLAQELSKPIFEAIRDAIPDLSKELGSADFKGAIRPFFEDATRLVKVFIELAHWTAENAGTISEVTRTLIALAAAYGAVRLGSFIVGLGREVLAHQANTAAIAKETAALEANALAKSRATARYAEYMRFRGMGRTPAQAMSAVRGFETAEAAGRQRLLGPGLIGRTPGARVLANPAAAGKMAMGNPMLVMAAAMAGWEIGKMLRRPVYGHNGDEDIAKGDQYNDDFNKKLVGFNAQMKAVSSVAEKNALVNDLLQERAAIEEKLAKETAPLLREELSVQLKHLDLMADAAGRVNSRMMDAAKARNKAEADKAKTERERDENAAGYEEGRKTFGKTNIETLQGEVAELSKGGTVDEQTQKYVALNKAIDAAKKAPAPDTSSVDQAQSDLLAAQRRLITEKQKGEKITVAQSSMGASMPGLSPQVTSLPIGDVDGAQKDVKAATEKLAALRKIHDAEIAERDAVLKNNTAEAEGIRKTIEKLKEKQKELDELEKAQRRSEEGVQIAEAESRGDYSGANDIRRRQGREDLEGQLRGAGHGDDKVAELLERFDTATKAGEEQTRARTRGDLEVGEMEASGDYAGAQKARRKRELDDYRENLSKQGFEPGDIDAMVERQGKLQGAEQEKALSRYNLDQKAMDLRAAGKSDEAQKYELAAKRDDMVEQNKKSFGVDEETAGAMADKRLGAEIQSQRSITASSLQRIGGGGNFGVDSKDPGKLLADIRDILKEIKSHTKPGNETTYPSDVDPGPPWL